MSAAAARARMTQPCEAPTSARPSTTSGLETQRHPSAVTTAATIPIMKPEVMTRMRPNRSIARPAGNDATAAEAMKSAGPRPRMPSTPVTSTSVVVATATASWSVPERHVSAEASRRVFRRIENPFMRRPL